MGSREAKSIQLDVYAARCENRPMLLTGYHYAHYDLWFDTV